MTEDILKILEVSEIWPDKETTVALLMASSTSQNPFVVWAERKSVKFILFSNKYFENETEARKSFQLLTEVVVEILDTICDILIRTPSKDPQ